MYSLLLLNGGVGRRVAADQPKQLLKVRGLPILTYSLVAADSVPEIGQIVLNFPDGWRDAVESVVTDYAIQTPVTYVEAGTSRHDSVSRMLDVATTEHVIIHESARPMVTSDDFSKLINSEHDNVSYMLDIPFTVAPVDPSSRRVTGYLERDRLRNVQLPQKFRTVDLAGAHQQAKAAGTQYTEDATLVADTGHDVFFIDGTERNIKVTTPTDVSLAAHLLDPQEAWDV